MRMISRRTLGVTLVGATVAGGVMLRKPAHPDVLSPVTAPIGELPPLQGMDALVLTQPPRPLAEITWLDALGATHHAAELVGRGVLINLWATWCVPCVAELPALAALARRGAGEGIAVLALSSDRGGAAVVRRYFDRHQILGLDVLIDPQGDAARLLGAGGVPTTIVVDRTGQERARLEGAADWSSDAAFARLKKLL